MFYAIKTECVSSKTTKDGVQPFVTANKTKIKLKKIANKNKDAPRITHSIWSNKNIAHWKMTWYFYWWRGDAWASPNLDACTCWIFLGVTWASPSLSFCPFFILLHHSSLPTLENFLHTKLNTILISSIFFWIMFLLAALVQSK